MNIGAVVLAAGQGTRMRSALPKVVHPIAGRPMIAWVLDALAAAGVDAAPWSSSGTGPRPSARPCPPGVAVAVQERQRGTGDAARVGLAALDPACDTVVVACGDTPLLARRAGRAPGRGPRRRGARPPPS